MKTILILLLSLLTVCSYSQNKITMSMDVSKPKIDDDLFTQQIKKQKRNRVIMASYMTAFAAGCYYNGTTTDKRGRNISNTMAAASMGVAVYAIVSLIRIQVKAKRHYKLF